MVEDLIKRLQDTVEEEAGHGVRNEAADLIKRQAARIAELATDLERARNERNAAHVQARREINKEYRDHLTALESERDALLAAAGKEAVAEPVAWFTDDSQSDRSATTWDRNVADRWRAKGWPVHPLYTSPTAALEKGDGRDAEWLAEVCEDADGTKHIEAVVEELDDIPTGTRLYAGTHMAWRPIETAPKDGTWILMTNGVDVAGGQWIRDEGGTTEYRDEDGRYLGQDDRDDFEGWMDWMGGIPSPTHWMPLPAPPAALSQKAGEQQ
jgi:hypothetical protein